MTAKHPTAETSLKNDYDSPWKEALERFFPEFLALLFPAIHAQIDWRVAPEAETLKGWKFRLIRLVYECGYAPTLILELFRLIDWMIRLPKGLEADFRQALYAYEEQHRMPYVTTVEQAGIQRGEATLLMRLFSCKFGPDSVETYRSRIESAEPEQLEAWSERLLTADTPETIFH
jgi:hypothetical protein